MSCLHAYLQHFSQDEPDGVDSEAVIDFCKLGVVKSGKFKVVYGLGGILHVERLCRCISISASMLKTGSEKPSC